MSTNYARQSGTPCPRRYSGALYGSICGFGAAALILSLASSPAMARSKARHRFGPEEKKAEHASKEPFGNIPKGPLQIFVSINQQKLHLYSDGVHVADTSVATGVTSLPTPLGVFSVIQKQVFHRSNIYSNAPMPFMQRITWSGVAMHEGESIGHRASHGCIRMPREFAMRLYGITKLGARVIVADAELKPADFADPHLFVHKDAPPDQAAAPATPEAVKTAQAVDGDKTIDAVSPATVAAENGATSAPSVPIDAVAAKPDALGLRASNDGSAAAPGATGDATKPVAPAAADWSAPTAVAPPAVPPVAAEPQDTVPMPLTKPAALATSAAERKTPIAIFVSRKEKKIYVRQNFEPVFDAAITIEHPEQPLGTHVFTAMEYLDDHTTFRWNVVSLPVEPLPAKAARTSENEDRFGKHANRRRRDEAGAKSAGESPPPQTPQQVLARLDIPQEVIDHISEMMVPGSSLVVSDQGLGDETGDGTDFIVVTR